MTDEPPASQRAAGAAWTDEPPASQRAAGAAWTEERGTSDEGRRCLKSGPEASGKTEPGGERENRASGVGIVVGATGAIGRAVVRRLTRRGLPVLAVARGKDALDELASEHDLVTPCPADIGSNDAIQAIGSALTGLDGLEGVGGVGGVGGTVRMAVFAAGLPVRGSADSIDPDALAIGTNIKVSGLLRLLHAVRDRLAAGSRFVTFAGSLGLEPRAHEAGPGAVNAAVFNLMRQISLLYGPRGVTTHTLSPGPADTPRLRRIVAAVAAERGAAEEEVWQEYVAQNSLGRLPTADELAWAVELLLDPEADLLHGSVLYLDAGGHRGIH